MPAHDAVARARGLLDLGRPKEALQALEPALADPSAGAEPWCLKALCELRESRVKDAERSAKRAIALDPDREWAHRLLANALLQRDASGAVRAATEAARLAPELPETGYMLTLAHLAASSYGNTDSAQRIAAHLLSLHPHSPLAYEAVARVDLARRHHAGAEWAARRGLELSPQDADLMGLLGEALNAQGRHSEAAQVFAAQGRTDVGSRARTSLGRMGVPALGVGAVIGIKIMAYLGLRLSVGAAAADLPSWVFALVLVVLIGSAFAVAEGLRARARGQMPPELRAVALRARREDRRPWALAAAIASLAVAARALAVDETIWAVLLAAVAVGFVVARRRLPRGPHGPLPVTWRRYPAMAWRAFDRLIDGPRPVAAR